MSKFYANFNIYFEFIYKSYNIYKKEYLFMRKNIKGIQFERWNHAHGCRKWFNVARDTSNDKIEKIYKMGEQPPKL